MGVKIQQIIREDPMYIESIMRKYLPVKGFKLGRAKLIFDKLIHIPVYTRRGSQFIWLNRLPISNSVVKGLSNKAKLIMRRSYGFRTTKTCQLALMHGLGQLEIPNSLPIDSAEEPLSLSTFPGFLPFFNIKINS